MEGWAKGKTKVMLKFNHPPKLEAQSVAINTAVMMIQKCEGGREGRRERGREGGRKGGREEGKREGEGGRRERGGREEERGEGRRDRENYCVEHQFVVHSI